MKRRPVIDVGTMRMKWSLRPACQGKRSRPDRIEDLLGELNGTSLPFHDHAPRHPVVRIDAVGLQRNGCFAEG